MTERCALGVTVIVLSTVLMFEADTPVIECAPVGS
jgi:hypothetical protein